jgi:hypothetical protein
MNAQKFSMAVTKNMDSPLEPTKTAVDRYFYSPIVSGKQPTDPSTEVKFMSYDGRVSFDSERFKDASWWGLASVLQVGEGIEDESGSITRKARRCGNKYEYSIEINDLDSTVSKDLINMTRFISDSQVSGVICSATNFISVPRTN